MFYMTVDDFIKKYIDPVNVHWVVHCPMPADAAAFCSWLDNCGRKWRSGNSYMDTRWVYYKTNTCYHLATGTYGDLEMYKDSGYMIIEYSDLKEMLEPDMFELLETGEWENEEEINDFFREIRR